MLQLILFLFQKLKSGETGNIDIWNKKIRT